MAHYAFLDENNIVTEVIVGVDETEMIEGKSPETWYSQFRNQKCVRTSYNNRIRKQYAGIGYLYNEENDVFIAPQPYLSWSLDDNFDWQAPKPRPVGFAIWNEESQEWVKVDDPTIA
jgi:hypothetical protein